MKNYITISWIIFVSLFVCGSAIVILNLQTIDQFFDLYFGDLKSEILKQFFFGSIGATIACSIFFNEDKELNEMESLKEKPDLSILRYPTKEDVHLYVQRIISSGILGCVGILVLLAGFGYLEIDNEKLNVKHKILFALTSFLIGLFQSKFYEKLQSVLENILKKKDD